MNRYYSKRKEAASEFILVKHSIRGFEGSILGVRYRDGYGVVLKNSKEYYQIQTMRPKPISDEFPLDYIQNLAFIVNEKQVKYIWGDHIYKKYKSLKDNPKKVQLEKNVSKAVDCSYEKLNGDKCKGKAMGGADYCFTHMKKQPEIKEVLEALPKMPKETKNKKIKEIIDEYIRNR